MALQTLPARTERHFESQRLERDAAAAAVVRQWQSTGVEWDSWRWLMPVASVAVVRAQERLVAAGDRHVSQLLRDTGQERADDPWAEVDPSSLIGRTGDGRTVEGLLAYAPVVARSAVRDGLPAQLAAQRAATWLEAASKTAMSDVARQSERLSTAVRPVSGYVRMLSPPSCSRCAILAGRWYRKSAGFQRHPRCDCRHIPANESVAGDLTVTPDAYFESLSPAEQDRLFTQAGAEAIRAGADMNQVVNARRGMQRAQVFGKDVWRTSEGVTRRGIARKRMDAMGRPIPRGHKTPIRLMPETLVEMAGGNRATLRDLLRLHGYLA